ncbi:hypothetical protein [Nesterenkonia pannonica]|uniref:hypothetical protein n=1 Tax=Nesterenkonia pannonica TaxID=1548602 RepID=UPI00216463A8|nr:hypothetical protein [Nesterenkonia pannonica]
MKIEGLDQVIADLDAAPRQTASKLRPIMRKGGVQMKNRMTQAFSGSRSFGQVARSIDFDFIESAAFGMGHMEVEVGPNASVTLRPRWQVSPTSAGRMVAAERSLSLIRSCRRRPMWPRSSSVTPWVMCCDPLRGDQGTHHGPGCDGACGARASLWHAVSG